MATRTKTIQVWIDPIGDDPEALSAAEVARRTLADARGLEDLRRARVFEISGAIPARREVETLLHRSIQFYNPHKERCTLRMSRRDPAPLVPGEAAALVVERGDDRRPAAERWWAHETGGSVEVREGVAWVMRFAGGASSGAPVDRAVALARVTERRQGLLCNPHSQWCAVASGEPPLSWIGAGESTPGGRA